MKEKERKQWEKVYKYLSKAYYESLECKAENWKEKDVPIKITEILNTIESVLSK